MKRTEIEQLLPVIFRRTVYSGGPLYGILEAMEGLHQPCEEVLRNLDAIFDARRTPDVFVRYLARWVDLDCLLAGGAVDASRGVFRNTITTGTGRLREMIADAADSSKWRGTGKGFVRFLETATGAQGFEVDERARPFHIRIRAPASTTTHRAMIEKIIEFQKPAYVTYELQFALEGTDR